MNSASNKANGLRRAYLKLKRPDVIKTGNEIIKMTSLLTGEVVLANHKLNHFQNSQINANYFVDLLLGSMSSIVQGSHQPLHHSMPVKSTTGCVNSSIRHGRRAW
jgi:hypothetical protein